MTTLQKIAWRLRNFLIGPLLNLSSYGNLPNAASQLALKMAYQQLVRAKTILPSLNEVGFQAYSQTDEDGILLFIFSIIGTTNKKCVEICAGNGIECNTANLIINQGWTGLLVDGNQELVWQGKIFYGTHRATYVYPPTFLCAWITRDNVNKILEEAGYTGEIDLLSLDMDGIDYWIWEAIEVINPRVVVLEYQDALGPERSLTVPYTDNFEVNLNIEMPNFFGGSLPAFAKLAKKKGYRLVGCNRYGYNAFFIRGSLGEQEIPTIPVGNCFKHAKVLEGISKRWPTVKDYPWVEV